MMMIMKVLKESNPWTITKKSFVSYWWVNVKKQKTTLSIVAGPVSLWLSATDEYFPVFCSFAAPFPRQSCQTSALSNTKDRLITWSSYWILAQTYNVVLLNILGGGGGSPSIKQSMNSTPTVNVQHLCVVCLAGDEKQQEQSQRPPDDGRSRLERDARQSRWAFPRGRR